MEYIDNKIVSITIWLNKSIWKGKDKTNHKITSSS